MFCPKCGQTQQADLNYCKSCGAHLQAVRNALDRPAGTDEFDWKRTWLAEAVMTREEKDRRRGITPEHKRRREIKAGIITASSGVGLSVVLSVLMEAIVNNGHISILAADILSRLWIVGLIPILVGSSLIVNGVFISPRRELGTGQPESPGDGGSETTSSPEIDQLAQAPHSVTDGTTRHLKEPIPVERIKTK